MTNKQKLILFLINCEPGIREIHKMVKIYDNADFPSNMSENLKPLLDNNFIFVSQNFANGTPSKYEITENGRIYLNENFDAEQILNYIKTIDNPETLLYITQTYIERKNDL